MNPTLTQNKLEDIRRGLSAVSLIADQLEALGRDPEKGNGFMLGRFSDTLHAAGDCATGALECLEKEIMK